MVTSILEHGYRAMVSSTLERSTSTILLPTGDQYPMVHLTQSFWMTVDPPILVADQILAHLEKKL